MSYLIIIHIGPVQDFIASARRSRDLWFGSWLLSELSKAAANSIVKQENKPENLIFPSISALEDSSNTKYDKTLLEPNSNFDVANKIVAIVESDPEPIAEQAVKKIKGRLNQIKEKAFNQISSVFNESIADKQIDDMLEIFWVAKKLNENNTNYEQVRIETERLMAARKFTNNYKKVDWGSDDPKSSLDKSSLDGLRESVIEYKNDTNDWDLQKVFHTRQGEHLCGVGLLKRHGQRGNESHFFSTSHIAALPFLSLFTEENKDTSIKAFKEYVKTLKDLGISDKDLGNLPQKHFIFGKCDADIFYKERLGEFFTKSDRQNSDKAKEALNEFFKGCEEIIQSKRPDAYYGLLHADGDNMGKAIAQQKTIEGHQNISKALSLFAKKVRELVNNEKHKGSLIYAGGDDVLALLPLDTILDCAKELSIEFRKHLKDFPANDSPEKIFPTLSIGIAIVHHLDPLSDALQLVRSAEKEAKSLPRKNALAITISKRSGPDITVKSCWEEIDYLQDSNAPLDSRAGLYKRLNYWKKLLLEKEIPHGVAYELRNLALSFSSKNPEEQEKILPILQIEAARILAHKRPVPGENAIDETVLTTIKNLLEKQSGQNSKVTVAELANEIIVADVFAKAEKLITPQPKKEG